MKAQVYSPTGRLGKARLQRELGPFIAKHGMRIGTRLGVTVIRTESGRGTGAWETRLDWINLTRLVDLFGYSIRVEATQREANVLLAAGFVPTNGGVYRLVIRDRRVAVEAGR